MTTLPERLRKLRDQLYSEGDEYGAYDLLHDAINALSPPLSMSMFATRADYEAAVTASPAQPSGFVLVPVEPTPEMLSAGRNHDDLCDRNNVRRIYAAMLTAAPSAPIGQEGSP